MTDTVTLAPEASRRQTTDATDPALAAVPLAARTRIAEPDDFVAVSARRVPINETEAWLVRFERADGTNAGPGGEHESWLVDEAGGLRGLTRMRIQEDPDNLPGEDEARAVAADFVAAVAPDLARATEESWVARHDESVRVADGSSRGAPRTVSGMKVKCRNREDGRYFWVVVGPNCDVVTFERDIVWNTLARRRATEQWLHDAWRFGTTE
ncbi:MAG: hypothetical protein RID91_12570 [Azospirillaceae bacterium]